MSQGLVTDLEKISWEKTRYLAFDNQQGMMEGSIVTDVLNPLFWWERGVVCKGSWMFYPHVFCNPLLRVHLVEIAVQRSY